jgi:hypothetical protein
MDDCSTFSVAHTGSRAAFVLIAGDRSYCSMDLGPPPLWTVVAGALWPALATMQHRPKDRGVAAWPRIRHGGDLDAGGSARHRDAHLHGAGNDQGAGDRDQKSWRQTQNDAHIIAHEQQSEVE